MILQLAYRLFAYSKHRIKSLISSKGYGIHSPFAFYLVTEIINDNSSAYYCYETIEKQRYKCRYNHHKITLKNGKTYPISYLCKRSSTPANDAQLLFKLGLLNRSKNILELGTFMGLGTAYLASISKQSQVISIDHDSSCSALARKNLASLKLLNVQLINDTIDNAINDALVNLKTVDLIFFDGNHQNEATLRYFKKALQFANDKSIFVFHDIHWSKGMNQAWHHIIKHPSISISIERYNMGIVFFDPQYQKQHFFA